MRILHFRDTTRNLAGDAAWPDIAAAVADDQLSEDTEVSTDGATWLGMIEAEAVEMAGGFLGPVTPPPIQKQPEVIPIAIPVADGGGDDGRERAVQHRELLAGRARWEWVEKELEALRANGRITGGMRAESKAHVILDMERGMKAIDSVSLRAPQFIVRELPQMPPTQVIETPSAIPEKMKTNTLVWLVVVVVIVLYGLLVKACG